jgi:hypothetical protein
MKASKRILLMGADLGQRYLSLFPASDAGFVRWEINTGVYNDILAYRGNNNIWAAIPFGMGVVGSNSPYIQYVYNRKLTVGVDETDASFTFSGSWTNVNYAYCFGGTVKWSGTAGNYVQIVTPACEWLSIYINSLSNIGANLVTIDGDPTAANLLPTAQDLVTAGRLAASCLVSGGGTLNPADRIFEPYGRGDYYEMYNIFIADNLPYTSHVVRLTVTGYKNPSSGGTRLYVAGYGYGNSAMNCSTVGAYLWKYPNVDSWMFSDAVDVWECAYSYKPTGASGYEWIGHTGHLKYVSRTYKKDGVPFTPVNGTLYGGTSIEMTQSSTLTHTESVPAVGSLSMTYRVGTNGLEILHDVTWAVAGNATGYPAMMPATAAFNRGKNIALGVNTNLTDNDNSVKCNAKSDMLMMWEYTGTKAMLLFIPDLSYIRNYLMCNTTYLWIQDRLAGDNKCYFTRSDISENIAVGDVWSNKAYYRFATFSAGAEATLG